VWDLWNAVFKDYDGPKDPSLAKDPRDYIEERCCHSSDPWFADVSHARANVPGPKKCSVLDYDRAGDGLDDKKLWIRVLTLVVKTLKTDSSLFLISDDLITRFHGGCFFVLAQLFHKTILVRPHKEPSLDQRFVIACFNFRRPADEVYDFLEEIRRELDEESSTAALLEIFPTPFLVEQDCFDCLYNFNEAKFGHQIKSLVTKLGETRSAPLGTGGINRVSSP